MELHLTVFADGLISKWDDPQPEDAVYALFEGMPLTITLTPEQIVQIEAARVKAAALVGFVGEGVLR